MPRDKKAEQVAKEAAEYAKKHGICSIHVPVGPLFVGTCVSRALACLVTPSYSKLVAIIFVKAKAGTARLLWSFISTLFVNFLSLQLSKKHDRCKCGL